MIQSIQHQGKFLHECTLQGETREQNVYPAHPNGIQLSKDRFLFLYTTRAYRGNDDERSGIYQLRSGGFDGPILKEGFICQTREDWDPFNDGSRYVKQHGHPVAFGVPKGALIGGRLVPHENIFAVMWRIEARCLDPQTGFMPSIETHPELTRKSRAAEWLQFRLNDAEDDIEILQPAQTMRQKDYEEGAQFCQREIQWMIKGFVPPVPMNDDCSEWIDLNTVPSAVMPARYRFNAETKLYEWVEAGPVIGPKLMEGSVARYRDRFVMAARSMKFGVSRLSVADHIQQTMVWWQSDDPFAENAPELVCPPDQPNWFPFTLFICPDGVLRRLGGCIERSPYQSGRDPIYMVDIDPHNGFAASNHRMIFDGRAAGLPMQGGPLVDFPKLMPHTGGDTQLILYRARSQMLNDPARPHERLTQEEIDASGIYWAKIRYSQGYPAPWRFVEQEDESNSAASSSTPANAGKGVHEIRHLNR